MAATTQSRPDEFVSSAARFSDVTPETITQTPAALHLSDLQHVRSNLDPIEAPPSAAPPPPPSATPKHLNVGAFGQALHATLKDQVAGYVMQLRKDGTTV